MPVVPITPPPPPQAPVAKPYRSGSATDLTPIVRPGDSPPSLLAPRDEPDGKPAAEPRLRIDALGKRPYGSATEVLQVPQQPTSVPPKSAPPPNNLLGDLGASPRPVMPKPPSMPPVPLPPAPPVKKGTDKLVPLLLVLAAVAIVAIGAVLLILRR